MHNLHRALVNLQAIARGNDLLRRADNHARARELAERRAEIVIREVLDRHYGGVHVPPPELRAHVGTDDAVSGYWSKGINSSRLVLEVFGAAPTGPVLDWGCGSGRTLTWLRHCRAWRRYYRGCDVDEAAIEWLKSIGEADVQVCDTEPPLPYADESLHGLFAFSVLTHIPAEAHAGWYRELHRILRPGARACVTTMGASLARAIGQGLPDDLARQGFAWLDVPGHYRHASITGEDFTRAAFAGTFEVRRFVERGYGHQDLWVLERS